MVSFGGGVAYTAKFSLLKGVWNSDCCEMLDGFIFCSFDEQTGRLREQELVTEALFRGQKNKK
jgi:hypothetical protein